MKRVLKGCSHLVTVLLCLMLIVTAYFSISSHVGGGVPNAFGHQMYVVLSGSMEPRIHTGSVIFDQPVALSRIQDLKLGDVITFRLPQGQKLLTGDAGALVTHRIVKIETQDGRPAFQTKGDANDAQDPWTVTSYDVVARYDNFNVPYLGYYFDFLKSKAGIGLLVILPGALAILASIISVFREILRLQKTLKKQQDQSTQNTGPTS